MLRYEQSSLSKHANGFRRLEKDTNQFHHKEKYEEVLGPEVPFLNVIGALMYLAQCKRPNISFAVNLLAQYRSKATQRH